MTASSSLNVFGSGTPGRLTKWTAPSGGHSNIVDSIIFESATGRVGIGTDTPTSKLTVQGMIETSLGGLKFPDGTVQTTAAAAGLNFVHGDSTLTGDGTAASPLGIRVPIFLLASPGESAVEVEGGVLEGSQGRAGDGMRGTGGDAASPVDGESGSGVFGLGGNSYNQNDAGTGVSANGGFGIYGGPGMRANGGGPLVNSVGRGGDGLRAIAGDGKGVGYLGGDAIFAVAGNGLDGADPGNAGSFIGRVAVNGNLSVTGTKNFKIDHPLDPENKYLYHAAIESSEVLNIYSGNTTTDGSGDAVVTLPEWFEAINRDFRYQLTVVGTFAQAIVADEIKHNQFKIKTNAPAVKVSWQVTGIRSDAAIRKHPFKVEEDKLQSERGYYLSPEAYDQPEERGVQWARNPQMMQELRQQRLEGRQTRKQKSR
jgi:hypothetical protein